MVSEAVAAILASAGTFALVRLGGWWDERKRTNAVARAIEQLDADEWEVVRRFRGQNTIALAVDDPVVAGLLAKGIFAYASSTGRHEVGADGRRHPTFPVFLSARAKRILSKYPT